MQMVREPWLRPIVSMHVAARMAQRYIRGGLVRRRLKGLSTPKPAWPDVDDQWRSHLTGIAAVRIQRCWRRCRRYVRFRKYRLYTIAITELTLWWQQKIDEPEKKAALALQRGYRRYCDKKVFRYYRDLLSFQNPVSYTHLTLPTIYSV